MNKQIQPKTQQQLQPDSIYQEQLRQARLSFNLAFGLTTVSAIIGFAGVLLLFSGRIPAGVVTTAGAATSGTISASWLKLTKETNDRLEDTAKFLEDEENDNCL